MVRVIKAMKSTIPFKGQKLEGRLGSDEPTFSGLRVLRDLVITDAKGEPVVLAPANRLVTPAEATDWSQRYRRDVEPEDFTRVYNIDPIYS